VKTVSKVQGVLANALSVTFANDFSHLLAALSMRVIEAQVEPTAKAVSAAAVAAGRRDVRRPNYSGRAARGHRRAHLTSRRRPPLHNTARCVAFGRVDHRKRDTGAQTPARDGAALASGHAATARGRRRPAAAAVL